VSRYDKYDPMVGGFRAPLNANWGYTSGSPDRNHADLRTIFAMGVNSSGKVLKFDNATTKFCGVMILTMPKAAGDIVDIMTSGEIVEMADAEIKAADTLGSGTMLFADTSVTTGLLTTTAAAMIPVGFTIETQRLIVRCDLGVS
jgi:hypothetical protein